MPNKDFFSQKRMADWDSIRAGAEAGETFVSLAKRFKVKAETIRGRSTRERWATPANARQELRELRAFELEAGKKEPVTLDFVAESVPTIVKTESSTPIMGNYSDFIAKSMDVRMRRALMKMPDPKTWRDIKTLDDMIRRAYGLDKVTGKTSGMFSGAFGVGAFVSEISIPNPVEQLGDS